MKKEETIRSELERMKRSKYRRLYREKIAALEWVVGSHKTIKAAAKAEYAEINRQTDGAAQ